MRTLATFLFTAAALFAQPLSLRECSVDGAIINSITGAPIPRAQISVTGPGNDFTPGSDVFRPEEGITVRSDAGGHWHAELVPCGHVSITANSAGFLPSFVGLPSPASTYVLTVQNPSHDVKLKLIPQSVIAGRVLDDQGEPIFGAPVSLFSSRVANGVRGIQVATTTYANDLGEFRFARRAAGRYIVCASVDFYIRQCYPGSLDDGEGGARQLHAGDEMNTDLTLHRAANAQVSGRVNNGPAGVAGTVALAPRPRTSPGYMSLTSKVREDGTFTITAVPQGAYMLNAIGYTNWSGQVPVDAVPGGVSGIQLALEPLITVTGSVRTNSSDGRKPERSQMLLHLQSPEVGLLAVEWDETRTRFKIANVAPGSYQLVVSSPPFYVKSVEMGGREISNAVLTIAPDSHDIEIHLDDDGGSIEGDLIESDSGGDAPVFAWVLLQRDGELARNATAGTDGHFHIDAVPPGNYKIYAWNDNTNVEYGNPVWMQRYAKGAEVTVSPGQTAHVKVVRRVAPSE